MYKQRRSDGNRPGTCARPLPASSTPAPFPSQPPSDRGEHPPADMPRSLGISAGAPDGVQTEAFIPFGGSSCSNMKHLASEVVVVEQRMMPRLPSACDLLRKQT